MEILYISIGVCVVLVAIVASMYNTIISGYEKVKQAWSDVVVMEQQKQKIIPKLQEAVSGYTDLETDLQTKITELRSASNKLTSSVVDVKKLKDMEAASSALMSSFKVSVEAYPDLKSSDLYKSLMQEITEQQDNIGAALRIFNSNVQIFNTYIQSFPSNIVNSSLNKKKVVDMFKEDEAVESVGFSPNL